MRVKHPHIRISLPNSFSVTKLGVVPLFQMLLKARIHGLSLQDPNLSALSESCSLHQAKGRTCNQKGPSNANASLSTLLSGVAQRRRLRGARRLTPMSQSSCLDTISFIVRTRACMLCDCRVVLGRGTQRSVSARKCSVRMLCKTSIANAHASCTLHALWFLRKAALGTHWSRQACEWAEQFHLRSRVS